MSKSNGQADVSLEDQLKEEKLKDQQLKDEPKQALESELPAMDPADGFEETTVSAHDPRASVESGADGELQKLRAERNDLFERLARLQAEFDNYRKRAAKENAEYRDYAVSDAARSLLPVVDSFTLALKNSAAKPEDLRKGVELIFKQLEDVLQKLNIERIPAQGEPFDPRVHEAIEMVETNEAPDHHVLEELQPGYRIKGRLLRPAMVRVAKKIG
ncbi:MAG TPA: nucleotide exchange factor GrpE [Candidatus Polarisedimenticolia bacterium]|jgi:molecular chaperone GrpE|nr:nucleotide exchange factor GrpE [Candidatus Polarisedimenticolia bacterium]